MKKIMSLILTLAMVFSFAVAPYSARAEEAGGSERLSLGGNHSAVIKNDGSLWMWGSNYSGQLGDGTYVHRKSPVKIMDNVKAVSLGVGHSLALKEDGSLWTWGENSSGQLGDGTNDKKYVPVKIMDNVKAVSANGYNSAAIKTDGSLWVWGNNYSGQLGDGTRRDKNEPVKVMDNVKTVSQGGAFTAAFKDDGSLWMWGSNYCGQLGDGTNADKNEPVKIMDNVKSVSLGNDHSAAIKTDGSLFMWGHSNYGSLGNDVNEDKNVPIKIMDSVKTVSLGLWNGAAVKEDGSLWIWGKNDFGQLGNGTNADVGHPQKIMDNVKAVSLGYIHSAAIKEDGSLWTWGYGSEGLLGDGTSESKNVPVKIMDNINLTDSVPTEPTEKTVKFYFDDSEDTVKLGEEINISGYFANLTGNEKRVTIDSDNNDVLQVISANAYNRLDTKGADIVIRANDEGTANIIVKCDGTEVARRQLKAEAVIAETISEDIVLKAEVLKNNYGFNFYRNSFLSPARTLNDKLRENGTDKWSKIYLIADDVLSALTLKRVDGKDLDAQEYYETILSDILECDNEGVWDGIYSFWKTTYGAYNNKVVQKITGEVKDIKEIKTSDFLKKYYREEVFDTIIEYSGGQGQFKEIKIETDWLDSLSFTMDSLANFLDATNEVMAYSAVCQEKIDVLKYIGENTSISSLKAACAEVIKDVEFAHKNTAAYWTKNFAEESAKDVFDFSAGIVTGLALKYLSIDDGGVTPYVPGVSEAMKIIKAGQFVSDALIHAGGISKDVLSISSVAALEEELIKCMDKAEIDFNYDKTVENAKALIGLADFYKATLLCGCDESNKLMEDTKKSDRNRNPPNIATLILNWDEAVKSFTKDNDYDRNIESINNIKNYIASEDFYSNCGVDIAAFISRIESTYVSDWAKPYVDKAISYGFVPEYLQGNYQNNITRAEFCTLLTWFIETYTDEGIYVLMEKTPYSQGMFKDTYYKYVYFISCLGLINGVSETEFNPLGEITREQAATLLMRTAEYLGIDTSAPDYASDDVSQWAKDGVNFVVKNGIMTGTDKGFSPKGKYTKEQVLTSFVRFYENLK